MNMAAPYIKILHIEASEEQVWHTLFNERNLEHATNMDSRKGMRARKSHEFRWQVAGRVVEGKVLKIDSPNSSSTELVYEWRFADQDNVWPPGHFAKTRLVLGDQGERTFVEMTITGIPADGAEDDARDLWEDDILGNIESFLEDDPDLERAF